jgi:hypothetical protein
MPYYFGIFRESQHAALSVFLELITSTTDLPYYAHNISLELQIKFTKLLFVSSLLAIAASSPLAAAYDVSIGI